MAWLENEGMGVCGYTYDQVSAMPMDAMSRAISARKKFVSEILRAAFGGETAPAAPTESRNMTPALFDALFQ